MPNAIIAAPDGAQLTVPYTGLSPDPLLLSAALDHYMSNTYPSNGYPSNNSLSSALSGLDIAHNPAPISAFAAPPPPLSPPRVMPPIPTQSTIPTQSVSSTFTTSPQTVRSTASPQTVSFPPPARPPYYSKEAQAQALAQTPKNVLPTADTSQFALDPTPYLSARAAAITHYTHLLQRSIATPTDTAQYRATVQKNMDALQKAQYFDTPEGKMLRQADITAGVYRPSAAPPPPAQAGGASFLQTARNFVQTQGQDAFSLLQGLYNLPQTAEKAAGNILQGGWAGIRGAYDEATGNYTDSQRQAQTAQNSFRQTQNTLGAMFGARGATGDLSETVTPSSDDLGRADPSALHHGLLGDLAIAAGTAAGGRHAQSVQQYGQIAGNVGAFTLQHPLLQAANVAPGAAELSGLARLGRLGEGARLVQGAIDAKAADAGAALAGRVYGQFPALGRGVGVAASTAGLVGSAVHDTLHAPLRASLPGLRRGASRVAAAPVSHTAPLSIGEALRATMPSLRKGGGTRALPHPVPPGVGPSLASGLSSTSGLSSSPGQFERMPSLAEGLSASSPAVADSLGAFNPGADPLSTYNLASAIIGNPADNTRMGMQPPAEVRQLRDASPQPLSQTQAAAVATHPLSIAADAARKRVAARYKQLGARASSGLDPTILLPQAADYSIIGADYLRRGFVDFGEWSKRMQAEPFWTETLRPHLQDIYRASVNHLNSLSRFVNRASTDGPARLKVGPNRHEVVLEDLLDQDGNFRRAFPVLGDPTGLSPAGRPDPFGIERRGGAGYGQIDENYGNTGWAAASPSKQSRFHNIITGSSQPGQAPADIGLYIKQKDETSFSNGTYPEAYLYATRQAIQKGTLTEETANKFYLKQVYALRDEAQRLGQPDPFNEADIKSFHDLENLRNMTFDQRKSLSDPLGSNANAVAAGLPTHAQVLPLFNDFNHVPDQHVLGVGLFDQNLASREATTNYLNTLQEQGYPISGHADYPYDILGVQGGYTPNQVSMFDLFGHMTAGKQNMRRSIEMGMPAISLNADIIKALGIRTAEESRANPIVNGPSASAMPSVTRRRPGDVGSNPVPQGTKARRTRRKDPGSS